MNRTDPWGNKLYTGEIFRAWDDRYEYQYTDATGKTCHLYGKTLNELRRKKEDALGVMRTCASTYLTGNISLNEAFEYYMAGKKSLKDNTRDSYYYDYNHYVAPKFGKRLVTEYKYTDIVFFYKGLIDKKYSVSTLDNIQNLLYPTFEMLYKDGVIRMNPADKALKNLKRDNGMTDGIRRALTVEQEGAFLNYVRANPECEKWRDLMIIMFGTGMRVSEVLGLQWENIDFVDRTITVNHAAVKHSKEKGNPYHISETKTKSGERIIPMVDEVYDAFDRIYRKQEREGWPKIVIDGLDDFIFINNEGRLLNYQNINVAIEKMRKKCNAWLLENNKNGKPFIVPHFTNHVIRHTFCSRLCEVETNIKVIQDIMGHVDIRTTMEKYAEVSVGRKKKTIAQHGLSLMPV